MCHPVDVLALADCDLILKPWKKQHKINIPTMLPSLLIRFSFPSRKNKGKKTKNSILRLVSSVCIPISSDLSSDGDNIIRERTKCFPPLLLCVSFMLFRLFCIPSIRHDLGERGRIANEHVKALFLHFVIFSQLSVEFEWGASARVRVSVCCVCK